MTTFFRFPLSKYICPSGNSFRGRYLCLIADLKDPRPFLTGDYDMWGAADADSPLYFCTGFIAFQPSPLSKDLLEKWKASLEIPDINQIKFNALVKKSAIRHKYPIAHFCIPSNLILNCFLRRFTNHSLLHHRPTLINRRTFLS
jgi:hypothetical protein